MRYFHWTILTVLAIAGLSLAATYEHKDSGISIWLPDNWKVSNTATELRATSQGSETFVLLKTIPKLTNLSYETGEEELRSSRAFDFLGKMAFWASTDVPFDWKKLASAVKDTNGQHIERNRLKFYTLEGHGAFDGAQKLVNITWIGTANGKICLLLWMTDANSSTLAGNKSEHNRMLQSLQVK